jgi:hypothetical protein
VLLAGGFQTEEERTEREVERFKRRSHAFTPPSMAEYAMTKDTIKRLAGTQQFTSMAAQHLDQVMRQRSRHDYLMEQQRITRELLNLSSKRPLDLSGAPTYPMPLNPAGPAKLAPASPSQVIRVNGRWVDTNLNEVEPNRNYRILSGGFADDAIEEARRHIRDTEEEKAAFFQKVYEHTNGELFRQQAEMLLLPGQLGNLANVISPTNDPPEVAHIKRNWYAQLDGDVTAERLEQYLRAGKPMVNKPWEGPHLTSVREESDRQLFSRGIKGMPANVTSHDWDDLTRLRRFEFQRQWNEQGEQGENFRQLAQTLVDPKKLAWLLDAEIPWYAGVAEFAFSPFLWDAEKITEAGQFLDKQTGLPIPVFSHTARFQNAVGSPAGLLGLIPTVLTGGTTGVAIELGATYYAGLAGLTIEQTTGAKHVRSSAEIAAGVASGMFYGSKIADVALTDVPEGQMVARLPKLEDVITTIRASADDDEGARAVLNGLGRTLGVDRTAGVTDPAIVIAVAGQVQGRTAHTIAETALQIASDPYVRQGRSSPFRNMSADGMIDLVDRESGELTRLSWVDLVMDPKVERYDRMLSADEKGWITSMRQLLNDTNQAVAEYADMHGGATSIRPHTVQEISEALSIKPVGYTDDGVAVFSSYEDAPHLQGSAKIIEEMVTQQDVNVAASPRSVVLAYVMSRFQQMAASDMGRVLDSFGHSTREVLRLWGSDTPRLLDEAEAELDRLLKEALEQAESNRQVGKGPSYGMLKKSPKIREAKARIRALRARLKEEADELAGEEHPFNMNEALARGDAAWATNMIRKVEQARDLLLEMSGRPRGGASSAVSEESPLPPTGESGSAAVRPPVADVEPVSAEAQPLKPTFSPIVEEGEEAVSVTDKVDDNLTLGLSNEGDTTVDAVQPQQGTAPVEEAPNLAPGPDADAVDTLVRELTRHHAEQAKIARGGERTLEHLLPPHGDERQHQIWVHNEKVRILHEQGSSRIIAVPVKDDPSNGVMLVEEWTTVEGITFRRYVFQRSHPILVPTPKKPNKPKLRDDETEFPWWQQVDQFPEQPAAAVTYDRYDIPRWFQVITEKTADGTWVLRERFDLPDGKTLYGVPHLRRPRVGPPERPLHKQTYVPSETGTKSWPSALRRYYGSEYGEKFLNAMIPAGTDDPLVVAMTALGKKGLAGQAGDDVIEQLRRNVGKLVTSAVGPQQVPPIAAAQAKRTGFFSKFGGPKSVLDRWRQNRTSRWRTNAYTKKDMAKAALANRFIGHGSGDSYTEMYAQASGAALVPDRAAAAADPFKSTDIVMVSAEGARRGRYPVVDKAGNLTQRYSALQDAVDAKATIVADNLADRSRRYNVGERELATWLNKAGYAEILDWKGEGTGVWRPKNLVKPGGANPAAPPKGERLPWQRVWQPEDARGVLERPPAPPERLQLANETAEEAVTGADDVVPTVDTTPSVRPSAAVAEPAGPEPQGNVTYLSPKYLAPVKIGGVIYRSADHAYQAMRTLSKKARASVRAGKTVEDARERAAKATVRKDWDEVKDEVLYEVTLAKFTQNPELADELIRTGNRALVHGGADAQEIYPENAVGRTLMRVRDKLIAERQAQQAAERKVAQEAGTPATSQKPLLSAESAKKVTAPDVRAGVNPNVGNLRKGAGPFAPPADAVDVSRRGGRYPRGWGNPYRIAPDDLHGRYEAIAAYERDIISDLLTGKLKISSIDELRGKHLADWCAPEACHGDVLARLARYPEEITDERALVVWYLEQDFNDAFAASARDGFYQHRTRLRDYVWRAERAASEARRARGAAGEQVVHTPRSRTVAEIEARELGPSGERGASESLAAFTTKADAALPEEGVDDAFTAAAPEDLPDIDDMDVSGLGSGGGIGGDDAYFWVVDPHEIHDRAEQMISALRGVIKAARENTETGANLESMFKKAGAEGWVGEGTKGLRLSTTDKAQAFVPTVLVEGLEKAAKQAGGSEGAAGTVFGLAEWVANVGRGISAAFDVAAPFVHGLPSLAISPGGWARATVTHYRALFDPRVQARYIRQNIDTINKMITDGNVPIGDVEFFNFLRGGGESLGPTPGLAAIYQNKVRGVYEVAKRQTFGRFAASYDTFLTVIRAELWKSLENTVTDPVELGRYIRNLTGGIDTIALGIGRDQRRIEAFWMAFSPKLMRSTLALLGNIVMHPTSQSARHTYRAFSQLAAGVAGTYVATGLVLGKDWEEIETGLNPLSGKRFLSHQMPNGDWVGVGGQLRAAVQMIAATAMTAGGVGERRPTDLMSPDLQRNPLMLFLVGRGAPGSNLTAAMLEFAAGSTGGDWNLVQDENIDNAPAFMFHMANAIVPFTMQSALEGQGRGTVLAGAFGARTGAERPIERLSRDFKEEFGYPLNAKDATQWMRADAITEEGEAQYPKLAEDVERVRRSGEPDVTQAVRLDIAQEGERLASLANAGDIHASVRLVDWRREYSRQIEGAIAYAYFGKERQTPEDADSEAERLYLEYTAIVPDDLKFEDPITHEIDYDRFFAAKEAKKAELPVWLQEVIDRRSQFPADAPALREWERGYKQAREVSDRLADMPRFAYPTSNGSITVSLEHEDAMFQFEAEANVWYDKAVDRDGPDAHTKAGVYKWYASQGHDPKGVVNLAIAHIKGELLYRKDRGMLAAEQADLLMKYFPSVLDAALPKSLRRDLHLLSAEQNERLERILSQLEVKTE